MEYPIFKSKDSEDLFKDFFMKNIDVIENYYLNLELKGNKIVRKRKYIKNEKNKFTKKDMVNLVNVYIIPKLYLYYANIYMDFSHNYEYYYNIYYTSYSSILNLKNIYFSKENPLNKRINIMIKESEDVKKKNVEKNYDIYKFIYEEKEQVNNYLGYVGDYVDKLLAKQEENNDMFKKKEECNEEIKEIKELLLKDLVNINNKLKSSKNTDVKTKFDESYTGTPENKISNIPEIIKLLSVSDDVIYGEIRIFLDIMENNYYDYKVKEKECELLGDSKKDEIDYSSLKNNIQQYIEKSNDIKDFISEYTNSKNNSVKQSKKERIKKLIEDLFIILNNIMTKNNSPILAPIFLIIYEITLFEDTILKGENTLGNIKDTITGLNESILSLLKDSDRSERKKYQEKQIKFVKDRQSLEKEKKSLEDKKGKLELDLQKYKDKNPIDTKIQKQIDRLRSDIENKEKEITKKESSISQLNSSRTTYNTIKLKYEDEIKNFKNQIDKLTIEINTLEIKFDQANRLKIQTQKNQYERPIKLLEIDIDSKDKSIKDIDEQSKNSGQSDTTSISNAEKDYFNYIINFINVYTSGKDSKNIIQRMFENDAIVRIYDMKSSPDQIKELKKIPFFRKQDESFFNFFQRGGANSLPEPFTETVKKYMLDSKKVNTFYVDAYFNYLARVNKEFNIYIQQLFLRLDSAIKTGIDSDDLCKKLKDTNDKLKIIIQKIRDSSKSTSSSINNSDYTKNLYPYTDFILAYFMILVYFINTLIMKILGCSNNKVLSGGGEPGDNNNSNINEIKYNNIKIYVREANKNSIKGMIQRIKSYQNRPEHSFIAIGKQPNNPEKKENSTQTNGVQYKNNILKKIKNKIKSSTLNSNIFKESLYKTVNNFTVEQLNELLKIENPNELINKIRINKKMN